jgi:hypothetical protein
VSYPERFPECRCRENARQMVMLHPELRYVEGHLVFPLAEPFGERRMEHAWNVTPDGSVVDSTGWAYENARPFRYERDALHPRR